MIEQKHGPKQKQKQNNASRLRKKVKEFKFKRIYYK